ncbi:MAG: hypothetical protein ACI4V7_01765 [Succinivibrionaceae bacterium]
MIIKILFAIFMLLSSFVLASELTEEEVFDDNGHYSEFYLREFFIPKRIKNIKFPQYYSSDVSLRKITIGPGSVVTNHFDISESFSKKQSIAEIVKHICKNKNLRNEMVRFLDSYDLVYYVNKKHVYTASVNEKNCDSFGL